MKMRVDKNGVVWLPYITKTSKVTINNETVWTSNKFANFFLKIKRLFIKSKYSHLYKKTVLNSYNNL